MKGLKKEQKSAVEGEIEKSRSLRLGEVKQGQRFG